MISNDLLKRTPVRLAGAFAILFALTVVALISVLYLTLVSELRSDIRQRVEEMSDTLRAIDAQQGFDGLAAVVAEEAKSVRDFDSIFLLRSDDGSFRAGNVQNVRLFSGWGELDRAWLPMVADKGGPDDRFFAMWTPVSKGHLLVGNSDRALREVQRILLRGLGWALIATILLAVGSAIYLARRAQQKIDVFATTLSKVSRGEIAERVPVTPIPRRSRSRRGADQRHAGASAEADRERQPGFVRHRPRLEEADRQAGRRLELALRNADDGASFRTQVEESLEELNSIVETFEALLRITQIEAGARRARFSGVELGTVLADVADIYEPVAEEAGDRLVRRLPSPSAHKSPAIANC